ncbi:protein OBERON 1-like [Melia azedarach]|uniref:Protein OBERON 1-like n=1 Tax=Melia azedarach TaxID=155640 RepID=A0ACC1YFN4_MELAZ|nr:protein OBERON 1-like [Melia azedarach]
MEIDLVENDNTNKSSETTPIINGKSLKLRPVSPEESGEGLPYAPINWPNPGDNWSWKVGRRIAITGHYLDRYLYPPRHLPRLDSLVDIDAFFASFSWKIPSVKQLLKKGNVEGCTLFSPIFEETAEYSGSDSQSEDMGCKAGNKKCNSFVVQAENSSLTVMPCDICCSEPRFCRDCSCILCNKTISLDHGGYSYIKCEATVGEGYICGHVAHLNCALRCYMAGTVAGSIGLDAEYCCRRCDAKTDLVSHVARSVDVCKSVYASADVKKILNLGVCILRGSQKNSAKELLSRIKLAVEKLNCGASLEDIWKVEDTDLAISIGISPNETGLLKVTNHEEVGARPSLEPTTSMYIDYLKESQKLEEEINQVLQSLRKSQESEYKVAEERLHAQKYYLCNLYQQLDKERVRIGVSHVECQPRYTIGCYHGSGGSDKTSGRSDKT